MSFSIPHPDSADFKVNCAVITVSDTRTSETDKSGHLIQQLLTQAAHSIQFYKILKDHSLFLCNFQIYGFLRSFRKCS